MKPDQVARRLLLIADGIDKSPHPSRCIAVDNMRQVKAALEEPEPEPETLAPKTEYSIQMDLSLTADFEGTVDRQILTKKFKDEIVAALKNSMSITARELNLTAISARVQPINIDCVVTEPEPRPE